MDKIICPNCGAAIKVNEPKCPFCGYINFEGAEEKFMRDLEKTEDQLNRIPQEQKKHYKKSMQKNSKIIFITFFIVIVIGFVLWGLYCAREAFWNYSYDYDVKAEMLWQREKYPLLDEMYEAGDYAGILKFEEEMYKENEQNGTHHSIYEWEHSDFINAYSRYENLKYYVDVLTKEGELSKYQAEGIVYYCMWFHFRDYDHEFSNLTEEDKEQIEVYRDYADEIFYIRLKFTDEEAEELYEDALEYGSIDPRTCYNYAKKIKKRFE